MAHVVSKEGQGERAEENQQKGALPGISVAAE